MDDPANRSVSPDPPGPAADADPAFGRVIGERYRLLDQIGQGGMGLIYRAEHTLMKKTVAIKLLHGELGQVGDAVKRFEREAQSASRLNHPNIIAVTDFGRASSGEFYLVMEYVPGISLADALIAERAQRMSLARALGIVRQMLSALSHAHAQGVVHRDLKPANIMLTRSVGGDRDDVVKILDFGIAKLTQSAGEEGAFTQNGMVFGTPSYMSPEQATAQDVDARADLYSCGVILFELLTGRKPFVAPDIARILAMQVTARPPRFGEVASDLRLPAALEDVVLRALEKDRARRFQNADEFQDALASLESALVPQAIAALAVSRSRALWSRARATRHQWRALYGRLPAEFRRFTPLGGVMAVVIALVAVPSLCGRVVDFGPPPAPKPVAPNLEAPLQRVEEAMASGRLTEARTMLLQLLSRHPNEARIHFQLGQVSMLDRKFSDAVLAYEKALSLDDGLRGDAALLVNLRGLLGERDKRVVQLALDLAANKIGRPSAALVAEAANEDPRGEIREQARQACDRVGCGDKLDLVKSYGQDLSQARGCDEKRAAVRRLGDTGNTRAIEVLKKARASRGALGGLFGGGNDCVRKDIDEALKSLGGA